MCEFGKESQFSVTSLAFSCNCKQLTSKQCRYAHFFSFHRVYGMNCDSSRFNLNIINVIRKQRAMYDLIDDTFNIMGSEFFRFQLHCTFLNEF